VIEGKKEGSKKITLRYNIEGMTEYKLPDGSMIFTDGTLQEDLRVKITFF